MGLSSRACVIGVEWRDNEIVEVNGGGDGCINIKRVHGES